MIRKFNPGEHGHVTFTSEVLAKSIPSVNGTTIRVNKWAKGEVVGYEKKGTEEKADDDFVGIKISEGDEKEGSTVWVPYSEFDNLQKHY